MSPSPDRTRTTPDPVDPRTVIAETVTDIRLKAAAYSHYGYLLATADMLAGVAERHTWPGCACKPLSSAPCREMTAALVACEAWRSGRSDAATVPATPLGEAAP